MAGETTFGRRQAGAATPPAPTAARSAPASDDLSPAAEAFRSALRASGAESNDFSAWMRRQRSSQVMAWVLGLALLAPGGLCFLIDLPWPVSTGLEALGLVGNWWLRRERRRRLRAIAAWETPLPRERCRTRRSAPGSGSARAGLGRRPSRTARRRRCAPVSPPAWRPRSPRRPGRGGRTARPPRRRPAGARCSLTAPAALLAHAVGPAHPGAARARVLRPGRGIGVDHHVAPGR